MRYRRFGRTGLMVSEVGLGGYGLGRASEEEAREIFELALKSGVNFIDTAPGYLDGLSESRIGELLGEERVRVLIATKVRLAPEELGDIAGASERSLAASLERLRRERVDLLQLHNAIAPERGAWRGAVSLEDALGAGGALEALRGLQEQGLARFIGITGLGDGGAVRTAMREGGIDSVQVYYNLLNASALKRPPAGSTAHDHGQLLPLAAQLGLGAIIIRAHSGGALGSELFREMPEDALPSLDRRRAERIRFLEDGGERTLPRLAVRYALEPIAASTVVPGVARPSEVADAVAAAELGPVSEAEEARLDALRAEDFGVPHPVDAVL